MSTHWNDPPSPTIPKEYQDAERAEKREKRRALAMAAAESAGCHDARGEVEQAEQDWRDVEDFLGGAVPREYHRARRRAAKASTQVS